MIRLSDHASEPDDCASVSPSVRWVSNSVRPPPPPVTATARWKRPLIARPTAHHCAPLHVVVIRDGMIAAEQQRSDRERDRIEAEARKVEALERMAATVERESRTAVDRIAERTAVMEQNAVAMAGPAELVSRNCQGVATAAGQALSNARTVAAATKELAAAIREISGQIAHRYHGYRNA